LEGKEVVYEEGEREEMRCVICRKKETETPTFADLDHATYFHIVLNTTPSGVSFTQALKPNLHITL
jgi:hypothetical protein